MRGGDASETLSDFQQSERLNINMGLSEGEELLKKTEPRERADFQSRLASRVRFTLMSRQ